MSPAATIRTITGDDFAALSVMISRLGEESGERPDRTASAEDLGAYGADPSPSFRAVIAELGSDPVGYCLWCRVFSTWRGRPGLYVIDLYVAPEARSGGLGRRLLAAAVKHEGPAAAYVKLDVYGGNRDAFNFYEALGFRGDEKSSSLVLEDAGLSTLKFNTY